MLDQYWVDDTDGGLTTQSLLWKMYVCHLYTNAYIVNFTEYGCYLDTFTSHLCDDIFSDILKNVNDIIK